MGYGSLVRDSRWLPLRSGASQDCPDQAEGGQAEGQHQEGDEYYDGYYNLVYDIEDADFMVAHNAKFELGWLERLSLDLAKNILIKHGFKKEEIDSILHCILHHRYRDGRKPQTEEAKILFDADKLDSIGAVGIARAFQFAGEVGARLHNADSDISKTESYSREDTAFREFQVKLKHVKDSLFTEEGQRLAVARHQFMQAFFDRLEEETKGNV